LHSLASIDCSSGEDHIHGQGFSNGTRQSLSSTDSRDDSELDFWQTELCVLGRNGKVTQQR